jgi:hypothetical protein
LLVLTFEAMTGIILETVALLPIRALGGFLKS